MRFLKKVTGLAYSYGNASIPECCEHIRYPSQASTDLLEACREAGGTFYKSDTAYFDPSAYCRSEPTDGVGYKFKCSKLAVADCYGP